MNRRSVAAAAILWFAVPQVLLWPFKSQLQQLFPEPTVWQAVGMFMSSTIIFALGVYCWSLRQRVKALEAAQQHSGGVSR